MIGSTFLLLGAFVFGVIATALLMGLFARLGDPARLQAELVETTRDKDVLLQELYELGQFIKADAQREGGVLERIAALRRVAGVIETAAPALLCPPQHVLAALEATDRYLSALAEHWYRQDPEHAKALVGLELRSSPMVYTQIAERLGVEKTAP